MQRHSITTRFQRITRFWHYASLLRSGERAQSLHMRSAGFTIVELLVSIAIIGLLMALLMPAVQSVRETGRKATCINHLKQFGIAIQAFEATNREYPRSAGPLTLHQNVVLTTGIGPRMAFNGYSVHAQILPELELSTVYSQFDIRVNCPDLPPDARTSLSQSIAQTIPVFQCPSEGSIWGTSYRVCTGPEPVSFPLSGNHNSGIFQRIAGIGPSDVVDGTSHTAMMSEKLHGSGHPGQFDPERDFWFTGVTSIVSGASITPDDMLGYCQASASPTLVYPFSGYDWMLPDGDQTTYNHVASPNSLNQDCSAVPGAVASPGIAYSWQAGSGGSFRASSYHPGGVNVLYADGSVRFVTDSVDLGVWRAMASIDQQD